jgi:hypothetical protein
MQAVFGFTIQISYLRFFVAGHHVHAKKGSAAFDLGNRQSALSMPTKISTG